MTNERYDRLMGEMDRIAAKVELFPASVQERVFTLLTGALTESERLASYSDTSTLADPTEVDGPDKPDQLPDNESQFIAMIKKHESDFGLVALTHPQFATYGTYVYAHLAPTEIQADEIGQAELANVYRFAGRKPPAKLSNQFNAARNNLNYLTNGSARGTFKLTAHGIYYVENDLLRFDEK